MTMIDPAVVDRMQAMVSSCKAEEIQHRFGISLNTWAKLRRGAAIRRSVAERLLERLGSHHAMRTPAFSAWNMQPEAQRPQA